MQEILNIMEAKKNKTLAQKLINKKPKTQPTGWE